MSIYKKAEEHIYKGFSPAARAMLGIVSGLFGVFTILMAGPESRLEYIPGAFCLLIAGACITRGRVRQFIGSTIAACVLTATIWYVYSMVSEGPPYKFFSSGSDTTIGNSLLALLFFGIPSLRYVLRARFGFGKRLDIKSIQMGEGNNTQV